ncbi:MAG: hypothetical protein ACRBFS_02715 [Aureispira sp.]
MDFIEALIPIVAILAVFGIPLSAIYTSYKLKMEKLRQEGASVDEGELRELRQQVGQLLIENELMKETLSDVQRSLGQTPTRIELTEYEKEQIKLDQENKDFY